MPLDLLESRLRSRLVHDVRIQVHLDLTDTRHYLVEAVVSFGCHGTETFLELAGASNVTLSGAPGLSHGYDGERIRLSGLGERNEVRVTAQLPYVIDGDGMTTVTDPADGERYVCSYTAMDIAHRVLPCFDQPDLKTVFTVSVSGPEHWTVLANGPAAGQQGLRRDFKPTAPISSYLFFVAAGPWVSLTWDEPYPPAPGGTLPFGWHARATQAAQLEREGEWLRAVTSKAFAHYTSAFDEPYAFADYQQVFSPGLNWGAMEFPGVVSFRDEYLTSGEPTAIQRQALASVICHEMAHMWFGDLVTMTWWEDSWLNESFADYMGYEISARIGESDGWANAALTRKPTAYAADGRRSTHPIAEDAESMPNADAAFANFDMITYAKGAAVLRQLVVWLGEEDFLAGVNRHLTRHRFGNAGLADFLDSLDGATERDVRGWAEQWLRTTGFDTIHLAVGADGVPVLRRSGSRSHRFTVTGYDADLSVVREQVVDLADDPVALPEFRDLVVLPNSADETYATLDLPNDTWAHLGRGITRLAAPLTRAFLWNTAATRVERGQDPVTALTATAAALVDEPQPAIFEAAVHRIGAVVTRFATPDQIGAAHQQLADLATAVLATGDESRRGAAARLLAHTSGDQTWLLAQLDGVNGEHVEDQELRWSIVARLAELGAPEAAAVIDAELERDGSNAGCRLLWGLGAAVPTREAKESAWDQLTSGTLSNREFTAITSGFWGAEQAELLSEWVQRAPAELARVAQGAGQAMGLLIPRTLPALPLDTASLAALVQEVERVTEQGLPTVAARGFNDRLDDLRQVLAARSDG